MLFWRQTYLQKKITKEGVIAALCFSFLSCGGSSSGPFPSDPTPSPSPDPSDFNVTIFDSEITQSATGNELRFELIIEGVNHSEQLNCLWQPDVNNTSEPDLEFACIVGQANTAQFQLITPNAYTGRLSVVLPDQSVSNTNIDYSIVNDSGPAILDVSVQFEAAISDRFYLYQPTDSPDILLYFPKKLALESAPGVASISRRNLVGVLLDQLLSLSETDWSSEDQLILASRFSLDIDRSDLSAAAELAGFDEIEAIDIQSPFVHFERRYVTDIAEGNIAIQCENITLEINAEPSTIVDCAISDQETSSASKSINLTEYAFIETLDEDLNGDSDISTIKGNFSIEYTLPGKNYLDGLFLAPSADISSTFQLKFEWPSQGSTVQQEDVTFVWSDITEALVGRVENGLSKWQSSDIEDFVDRLVELEAIRIASVAELSTDLELAIRKNVTYELFVSLYASEDRDSVLFYVPRLRFDNIDVPLTDEVKTIRYRTEGESFYSDLDLSCLEGPDSANNLTRGNACNN